MERFGIRKIGYAAPEIQSNLATNRVGTADLGCPAERSSAIWCRQNLVELRSTGQPGRLSPRGSYQLLLLL